ncbi:hypothetical protein M3O96_09550 [Aquiflexum sp. TKW24L]|uniref:hypothetical protein n=1 Tax=Aquiflexum sp. TKW24L TaxID=2942212 RepID=UPI0020C0B810|nr:hypothetical protein [Aquiflexum sp. TKW24L]MCL6259332.1 hypothetical protein [Aquiflexum sp. TKW24L]
MKKTLLLFLIFFSFLGKAYSQEKTFFSQTDFGTSFGQVKTLFEEYTTRVNFSFQTLNGVWINKYHATGFLVGVDTYPNLTLMPLGLGWRGFMDKGKRHTLFAGMDLGAASAMLEKRVETEWTESWYEGGLFLNPSIGIRRQSKKGKHASVLSIGYKRQEANFYEGSKEIGFSSFRDVSIPPGFSSVRREEYIFNSLVLKWGFIF